MTPDEATRRARAMCRSCGKPGVCYDDLRRVLADPSHEDHDHLRGWIGGPFEPSAFDLALTNAVLQNVR